MAGYLRRCTLEQIYLLNTPYPPSFSVIAELKNCTLPEVFVKQPVSAPVVIVDCKHQLGLSVAIVIASINQPHMGAQQPYFTLWSNDQPVRRKSLVWRPVATIWGQQNFGNRPVPLRGVRFLDFDVGVLIRPRCRVLILTLRAVRYMWKLFSKPLTNC